MKLVVVLVIVLMLFTGFSVMGFHSSVQKNKISIGNFNVQSTNHICSYFQINIKNSPSGTGYYQQLFILTNPILLNSLNANRSNFYIASSNNTFFYTWIEAYNFTSLTIWSKIPNGTTSVNFEVFPKIENLLSASGYLGEAPQLSTTYEEYNNFNEVAFNGQITVNNTTFLTNSFSNALGVNTLFTSNLSQMALKYHNDTITSQNFTTQTIDGLGLTSNTSKNYSSILWNYDFPTTGTFWVNYTEYAGFLNGGTWGLYLSKNSHIGNINDLEFANLGGSPFNTSGLYTYIVDTVYYTGSMEINYNNDTIIQNTHRIYTGNGEWDNQTITTSFNPIYWQFNGLLGYASDGGQSFTAYFSNLTYAYEGTTQHIIASPNNAFFPDNPNMLPNNKMPTFTTSSQIMFTYHIQVKSFNNQNTIKNCFKYNNNVYNSISNTFIFSNSSKFIFSILPQNYTILNTSYLTNTSIINIKQNQYTSANFINYYYNISISYFSKTSTPINYYSPPNYYFTIGIIIFLLIGGLIIYTKIRNGD